MSKQSRGPSGPVTGGATRQNEYFVPRDGIDREVISADICRYLGNDALVRPGNYEDKQSGQRTQGYFITAYRNLTTAMIEDLKADSARWDNERRAQSSRNASGVQYRYSETHQSRQHHGPSDSFAQDPYSRSDPGFDAGPRYPGTGTHGYTGASGASYGGQAYPTAGNPGYGFQQPPQSAPQDPRFASPSHAGQMMNPGYQPPPETQPYMVAASQHARGNYPPQDSYGASRMSSSGPPIQQATYATAAPSQPGYPAQAPSNYGYGQNPPPGSAYGTQAQDSFYGRASPGGQPTQSHPQGYVQDTQMTDVPNPRPTSSPIAAAMPSGSSGHHSNRDIDRHSTDRHSRPPPRR